MRRKSVDKASPWYTLGIPTLWGTALGAVACLLLLLLLAAILTAADLPPAAVMPMALVGGGLGALVGGLVSGLIGGVMGVNLRRR